MGAFPVSTEDLYRKILTLSRQLKIPLPTDEDLRHEALIKLFEDIVSEHIHEDFKPFVSMFIDSGM